MSSTTPFRRLAGRLVVLTAVGLMAASSALPALAKPTKAGFLTTQDAMLDVVATGGSAKAIMTVGETFQGFTMDALPDGISFVPHGKGSVDIYLNHETSLVPFPLASTASAWLPTSQSTGSQNDYNNAQLSRIRLHQVSAGVLEGEYVIPSSANYQRFCSNFLATSEQGFDRRILFTNEEATDFVDRTADAGAGEYVYPALPATEPPNEQAGVVVAYDIDSGAYKTIYGMGRHNHENSVAIPGYDDLVLLSGDDTFAAPSSQLYSYVAEDTDAVWNDTGSLYAFKSDVSTINDYGDLTGAAWVSGTMLLVPPAIANGPQGPLEAWSNENNVFQFIRIEDIAYDRNDNNVVYLADTGEPRAIPGVADGFGNPPRLARGPNVSPPVGAYPNGRIFKMTLNATDPLVVDRLEILVDADAGGYNNPGVLHQPDNLETTENSVMVQEDPGSHNAGTPAKIWRYNLDTNAFTVVATVDQGADGEGTDVDGFADGAQGAWESSGIIDVSSVFGPGTFLVTVQASTLWVEKETDVADLPDDWTRNIAAPGGWTAGSDSHPDWMLKRSGGQLLLITIPGA